MNFALCWSLRLGGEMEERSLTKNGKKFHPSFMVDDGVLWFSVSSLFSSLSCEGEKDFAC